MATTESAGLDLRGFTSCQRTSTWLRLAKPASGKTPVAVRVVATSILLDDFLRPDLLDALDVDQLLDVAFLFSRISADVVLDFCRVIDGIDPEVGRVVRHGALLALVLAKEPTS